jgi:hypothetical protein
MGNLGLSENPLHYARAESTTRHNSNSEPPQQPINGTVLNRLAQHAWDELPYEMMRLTARESARHHHFYWRDQVLYLNDAQLSFATFQKRGQGPSYSAFFRSGPLKEDLASSPTLEGTELRWITPGLSDSQPVTSQQLAAKLLNKLVNF